MVNTKKCTDQVDTHKNYLAVIPTQTQQIVCVDKVNN